MDGWWWSNSGNVGRSALMRRRGWEIHLLVSESASQPDVCCKPGTLGWADQAMLVSWFQSCSCRLRGRVTILALDLGDSVMIDTCGLTSSCRHVGSDQPASTPVCEFHHILYVIPLCCKTWNIGDDEREKTRRWRKKREFEEQEFWKTKEIDLMQCWLNKVHQHHKWRQQKSGISFPECQGAQDKQLMQYLLKPRSKWKMLRNYWKFPNRNVQTLGFVYHDTNVQNHGPAWKTQSFFLNETCMVIFW